MADAAPQEAPAAPDPPTAPAEAAPEAPGASRFLGKLAAVFLILAGLLALGRRLTRARGEAD